MNNRSIDNYVSDLTRILEQTLSSQYAEEIAAETKNHLCERATELRESGRNFADAESTAIEEFGELRDLSIELAKGYPPKTAVEPRRLRFLPEIAVIVLLFISSYSYTVYGGWRGIETAAGLLLTSMPILMVPGMVAGLGRLKYRRLHPVATLFRLSTYGLVLCLISAACLVGIQVAGKGTLVSVFPIYYAFASATLVMYSLMRISFTNGKVYSFLRSHIGIHIRDK